MAGLSARDLVPFKVGNNQSDTLINGRHFNLTALQDWNYNLYSNGTVSNSSKCYLTFSPHTPALFYPNGSWVNATSCYSPVRPIGTRAGIGVGFAVGYGLCLVGVLVNLARHGKLHLPAEMRFRPIGRRWQWYWAIWMCAAGLISLLMNVDVDRYYLPELPLVLSVFFWYLLQWGAMACVWEAVRHWGSWKERQFVDPNPFVFRHDDSRAKVEFWLPLSFYFCLWMNFFMLVPRSWGAIERQRYPEQILFDAIPACTSPRQKIAACFLLACWFITAFSLRHSVHHYCERNRGVLNRAIGLFRFTPVRMLLFFPLCLAVVAYQAVVAWIFEWSPLNVHGDHIPIFVGGYLPSLLILLVQIVSGLVRPNEDRELQRQRRLRGEQVDAELGIVRKPAWWRRVRGGAPGQQSERMFDRIARNVRELGGGSPTARSLEARWRDWELETASTSLSIYSCESNENDEAERQHAMEMACLRRVGEQHAALLARGDFAAARAVADKYYRKAERRRAKRRTQARAGPLFPTETVSAAEERARRRAELMSDGPPPYDAYAAGEREGRADHSATAERNNSTGTMYSITAAPQQVRSMLNV